MSDLALNNSLTSIIANKKALDVISHNIANASDEHYSRQRAEINSNIPLLQGNNFFGTGVNVGNVDRIKDKILESRIVEEKGNLGRFNKLKKTLSQIETILNEPSDNGLQAKFSDLNTSITSVSDNPRNRGSRNDMISSAVQFASQIRRFNRQLKSLGGRGAKNSRINQEIQSVVNEINRLGREIATLNTKIANARGRGGNPNDLLDRRDEVVGKLAKKIDTRVSRERGKFRVNVNGFTLVQGKNSHELSFEFKNENSDRRSVIFDNPARSKVKPNGGSLRALLDLRDKIIPNIVDQVNDLVVQYVDRFNDQHQAGFGRDGQKGFNFFEELEKRDNGIFRIEGSGEENGSIEQQRAGFIDSPNTVLTGDQSTDQPENFEDDEAVKADPTGTLTVNDETIKYDMSEDSIKDIIGRLNQTDNGVEAYLSAQNRLVLKGSQKANYELNQIQDTGLLLEKTNNLTVGGKRRTGVTNLDDISANLVDAGTNFDGDSRIDNSQPLPAQGTISSGSNVSVSVNDASLFSAGQEVTLQHDGSPPDRVEATVQGVDNSTNTVFLEIGESFDSTQPNARITTQGNNMAHGTLELDRAGGNRIAVNYDAENDSLQDIVSRINSKAANEPARIRAGISDRNQLEIFAYKNRQMLAGPGPTGSGNNVTVNVSDASQFSIGQEVGISDDSGGEITTVEDVNVSSNTITVDLDRSYDPAQNGQVTTDLDGEFRADDVTSQQLIEDSSVGDPNTIRINDPAEFSVGDDVVLTNSNLAESSETATVTEVDESAGTITVDGLSNTYATAENSAVRKKHTNESGNLLNVLGMHRKYDERRPGTEFATKGEVTRPPEAEPAANIKVNETIKNNPSFIAAAAGQDTDLDGVAESTNGPGDGNNALKLTKLKGEEIMKSQTASPEESLNNFITDIGSKSALFKQEQASAQRLVNDLEKQRQQISGVSIDRQLTKLLQHQQAFQAAGRVVSTVQQLNQSLIQLV